MKFINYIILILLSLTIFAGPAAAEVKNVVINVSKNDSLIEICNRYLKKPEMWRNIARINALSHPDRLSPGQKISIPVDMLKTYPMDGLVTSLQGKVFRKNGITGWTPLRLKDVIKAGSSLKTEAASEVEISFDDGTSFTVRENTVLNVKSAEKGMLHMLRVLFIETGKVVSRVKAATGKDSRFEIETPSALAAARGTEFRVGVDETSTTRAEMLESSIAVSAMGQVVVLNKGEGSVAKKNEPPSPPVKLLPPPKLLKYKQHDDVNSLEFQFSKIENAVKYRVLLATDRNGTNWATSALVGQGQAFRTENSEAGRYYLIASSIDENGLEGPLSEPEEIVVVKKLQPPAFTLPFENARLMDAPVEIRWQPVTGAVQYQLQISADSGYTNLLLDAKDIKTSVYESKRLDAGQYFIRVRSVSDDGVAGAWSANRSIVVIAPAVPEILKPSGEDKQVSVEWGALPEAISYVLQISSDADFRAMVLSEKLTQTKYVLNSDLQPGKYYVRICGVNQANNAGSFSGSAVLEVEGSRNYVVEIIGTAGIILLMLLL